MLTVVSTTSYGDFLPVQSHSVYMDMGSKIKAARKAANITQSALAEVAGVSRNAVSQWENGETYPTNDKLERIARKLGVPVHYLLGEESAGEVNYSDLKTAIETILEAQRQLNRSYTPDILAAAVVELYKKISDHPGTDERHSLALESILTVVSPEESPNRN